MPQHRPYGRAATLVLLAMIASCLPTATPVPWSQAIPQIASAATSDPPPLASSDPPPDEPQVVAPVAPEPFTPQPGLALEVQVAPDPLAVGETATISVTVTNRTPYPAEHLLVTAPTPDGAIAQLGPGQVAPDKGWQWSLARLAGQSSTVLTGTLQLVAAPPGAALLASASATADLLTTPAQATGGALVVDRTRGPAMAAFTPGVAATLRSQDGRVVVRFPANAAKQALTLRQTPLSGFEQIGPPDGQGLRRSLNRFALDASTLTGAALHQFDAPLTLSVSYTPEQLQARSMRDVDLTLFWFDDAAQRWTPLPTDVDTSSHTASASVDHFTTFALSDGMSASELFIPSLQGFQTSSFTGAASYHIAIDTPAGAGGLKPSLGLNYSSAASDGSGGDRDKWQASWVGKGWSLDAEGFVARNRSLAGDAWDHFTLVFGGRSFDVVRGQLTNTSGCTSYTNTAALQCWTWQSTDENFTRVRAEASGGDYFWRAWATDGTRYDFTTVLYDRPDPNNSTVVIQSYKWLLTQVTDTHGNKISYNYQVDAVNVGTNLWVHPTYRLTEILWGYDGATPGTGTPRFRAEFVAAADAVSGVVSRWVSNGHGNTTGVDLNYEYPNAPNAYWQSVTPHEQYRLDQINLSSQPSSGWQLMRRYDLYYASASDTTTPNVKTDSINGQAVLTLKSVQRAGKDGTTVLPATSFTYNVRGTNQTPNPGGNRLHSIDNGQGGTLTFGYQNVWSAGAFPGETSYYYENYHRLSSVTTANSAGPSSTTLTTYSYTNPARNDIGYAATVEYAAFPPSGNGDSRQFLAQGEKREFRGHATVIERHYDGPTTGSPLLQEQQTWFHQGNGGAGTATCTPATTPVGGNQGVVETDACYQTMLQREAWKGRAYQVEVRNGSASTTLLQRTVHTFARIDLPFFGSDSTVANSASLSNNYKRAGLWRAFTPEIQTDALTFELGTSTAQTKTTKSFYNANCTADTTTTIQASYGNIGCVQELDGTTLIRKTLKYFKITDGALSGGVWGPYIVDRMWGETVYNGSGGLLALSHRFYDTTTNPNNAALALSKGELQRVLNYYDVPASCCTNPLHGQDMTYSYDAYGNRLTEKSYAQAGVYTPSSTSWSTPGNGSTARTTTTDYDTTFHALPTQVSNPLAQIERAGYDYRMGTLIRVTGPNTATTPSDCSAASFSIPATEESTCAVYDVFGRLVKLVKPGDSSANPTLLATYYDSEMPFRYRIDQREVAGQSGVRTSAQFYDGLGRKIQTKAESDDGVNAIVSVVTDTRYDGLNRIVAQSQPFYRTESSTNYSYTAPGATLNNQTTTSYDALGRPLVITAPGSRKSEHHYGVATNAPGTISYDDVIDGERHRTQAQFDALGRRVRVLELNGNCADTYWTPTYTCAGAYTTPWATASTTTYAYTALDQLKTVTDAAGNVTSLQYDSLGRKSNLLNTSQPAMRDPDMGDWNYSYDANGNLTSQVDAKGQTISFSYDTLNRLTSKTMPGGWVSNYVYDQTSASNKGIGHRTSISTVLSGVQQTYKRWEYDARGRTTLIGQSVAGVTTDLISSYDSADRITTMNYYEASETVTYTYDAGWRPKTLCSSIAGQACYASGAKYTALSQPASWTLGNTLTQNWVYNGTTARLSQLKLGSGSPASIFDRSYSYDNADNVTAITDNKSASNSQTMSYDERERLTCWKLNSSTCSHTYSYDVIGNLTSRTNVGTYGYGAQSASCPAGALSKAHAAVTAGSTSYCYDRNGNMQTGGAWSYTWNADNTLGSMTNGTAPESYLYDADGERDVRTAGGVTTVYFEGVWEQTTGGARKLYYTFNGQTVAMRDSTTNTVTYLHGDHLGSVSVATTAGGALASSQEFDPWGRVRTGGIGATSLNYTGQRLDATGLLYYHARYYNPLLARFISADSVVPGNASGGMAGVALKGLTVDFHEPGFAAQIGSENGQPFWFQMSDKQRQKAGSPWGPRNPQALNRYSYVLNGPMRWTDPSGHDTCYSGPGCGGVVHNNTNHSIWVMGSVEGPCERGVCENVLVEIPAGKSSVDMGVYDADAVVTTPLQRDSNGTPSVEGAKLVSSERATVSTNADGTETVSFEPKYYLIWWWTLGERKLRKFPLLWDAGNRIQTWTVKYVKEADKPMETVEDYDNRK